MLEPGERATVGTGLAVEIPEGYAGFVQPPLGPRGAPRDRGRQLPGPHRLGLPAAGPRRAPEHGCPGAVRGRAGHGSPASDRPRRRRSPRRGRRAQRERARRAGLRLVGPLSMGEPWSESLRSCGGGEDPAPPAREGGDEVWLLPGGGVAAERACCTRSSVSSGRRRASSRRGPRCRSRVGGPRRSTPPPART